MIKRKRATKYKERHYAGVTMPEESWGICVSETCSKHKSKREGVLGDGLCQKCFDKMCGPGLEKKRSRKKKVESTRCPECDQPCNDDRVKAGMKCGVCSYA